MFIYKWPFWVEGMDFVPFVPLYDGMKEVAEKAAKSLDKLLESKVTDEREAITWQFFEHFLRLNEAFNSDDVVYHDRLLQVFHKYGFLEFKRTTASSVKCRMIPKRHNVIFADTKGNPKFQLSFRTYRELQENTCNSFSRIYRQAQSSR